LCSSVSSKRATRMTKLPDGLNRPRGLIFAADSASTKNLQSVLGVLKMKPDERVTSIEMAKKSLSSANLQSLGSTPKPVQSTSTPAVTPSQPSKPK
jgi:hypothetical protein